VITVPPELIVDEVEAILLAGDLDEVPVLDGKGRVIGRVTLADLLRHKEERGESDVPDELAEELRRGFQVHFVDSATAAEVMSPPPMVVSDSTPIDRAARRLAKRGAARALVTHRGRLVGAIAASDLLGWLLREGARE
jgi:CBS domain-containing protein